MAESSPVASLPLPPYDLLQRIGPMGEEDPVGVYEATGVHSRQLIEAALPDGWSLAGKRLLDFGCGVGRVLRQFAPEAEKGETEVWGCDIDGPSVEWLQENLSPPFHFFQSEERPGLPQEDGFFDLVYAFSVYTHLTAENWAGWLLEHHRVLAPGGLLFATFLGKGMMKSLIDEEWDEDRVGMNVLLHGNPWEFGGPVAFNSPWWLEAHWGRAFEIVEICPVIGDDGFVNHGYVVARKKDVSLTEEDLKSPEPGEPREYAAVEHNVEQLAAETMRIRAAFEDQQRQLARLPEVERELAEIRDSLSWRLTGLLRSARRRIGR